MRIDKLLLAIGSLFVGFASYSQMTMSDADYIGSNKLNCTALSAGGLNFVDMAGNYTPNFDDTITFCPDLNQGTKVSIAFATNIGYEFNIDPSDTLYIFDGTNTSAPLLAAANSATNPTGGNWQASFVNNPSGCLTVRFKSDAINEGTGWFAKVACGNLAQPYYPHLEAFVNGNPQNVLNPIDTGYVNVCLGDSILFVAKHLFPYSFESTGHGYLQNLNNINYNWTISNVGPMGINNDSIWFVPTQRQGYFIDLKTTDIFPQLMGITAKVRVSILPSFATAGPVEDTICIGVPTDLIGGVTAQDTAGVDVPGGEFSIGGSFAGLTFLPDGNGQVYETTINISGLGGGTVTQASDIASICLDIEHSFIGDLEIAITCPNGTMVSLMNTYDLGDVGELIDGGGCYGGSVFLGNDTNDDGGAPGSPVETYCFSFVNPDFGTICNNLGNTYVNTSGFDAMIPGTYTPDGNFADLIGCPLDGDWTITVQDNQGQDDGYIFQWGIQFDASLYPNFETYQNYYVNGFWSPSPNIISGQNDTLVVIQTTAPGHSFYTYNVVDDFGCAYDTTFDVFSLPLPIIFPDTIACDMAFQVSGTQAFAGGVWSAAPAGLNFSSTTANNPHIAATNAGTYIVSYIDNACNDTVTSSIIFPPYPQIFNDTLLCSDEFQVVGTQVYSTGGYWSALSPEVIFLPNNAANNPIITATTSGQYMVTFTDSVCNNSTSSQVTLFLLPQIFPDTAACNFIYNVQGTVAANGGVWSAADTNIHFSNPNILNPIITSSIPGIFEVTFTDSQCNTSITSEIEFINYAYVNTVDTIICIGGTITTSCGVYPQNDTYVWSNGTIGHDVTVGPGVYTVTVGNECNTHSSTMTIGSKVCYITAPNIIVLSSTSGNNKFFLNYDGVAEFHISIVNRWGNLITEYSDPAAAWDGRNLNGEVVSEGTYFYNFTAKLQTGEEIQQQGFVQVFH